MTRIAINGFGRIGRAAFRVAASVPGAEIVGINDLTDTKTLAHLLAHDSVYGTYGRSVVAESGAIVVDGKRYPVTAEKDPTKLPWKDLSVDVVLECTGRFRTTEQATAHITAGAKKVIISAPAEGGTPTIVRGVNDSDVANAGTVLSNASCTTNSLAPVMAVIEEAFGIQKAIMSTIHSYTADQTLVDGPHKDLRRARSAAVNIVPTTTGAATATTEVIPSLVGLFDGISFRVPTPVVSVSDVTVLLKRSVTAEEVNNALREAAASARYAGIIRVTDEPLVSSDFRGDPASSIIDASLTQVVGGDLVKIVAWYDNEWGYSNRLVELAVKASAA